MAHRTEVLILQHPLEVHEAKGTARLLHLSLPHSRMVTGERFDASALQPLLTAPFDATDAAIAPRHALLLYPEAPQDATLGIATPPPLNPAWLQSPERLRLVVLAGTWRKSRTSSLPWRPPARRWRSWKAPKAWHPCWRRLTDLWRSKRPGRAGREAARPSCGQAADHAKSY